MTIIFILHIMAVACVIAITALAVSLWRDLSPKHKALVKSKLIGGAICSIATSILAIAVACAMFIV